MLTMTDELSEAAANAADDFELKRRITVVRLLRAGFSYTEVAETTGMAIPSIRRVQERYRLHGIDGLRDRRKRALRLSADQRAALKRALDDGEIVTSGAAVRRWLQAKLDRRVSRRRAQQLLAEAS